MTKDYEYSAAPYFQALLGVWRRTIFDKLPRLRQFNDGKIKSVFETFAEHITTQCLLKYSMFQDQLGGWQESTFRILSRIQKISIHVFNTSTQERASAIHRLIAPKIQELWFNTYQSCAAEMGKGHYIRNQKAHVAFIQAKKRTIYKRCSNLIREKFRAHFRRLASDFGKGIAGSLEQIKEDFTTLMDSNTLHGGYNELDFGDAKKKLFAEVDRIFTAMRAEWEKVMVFEVETVEIMESDDKLPTLDDLLSAEVMNEQDDSNVWD